MVISEEEIKKLAELARIDVPEDEIKGLQKDMEAILEYVKQIGEVATKDKKPETGEHRNIIREDGEPHKSGIYSKDLLAQAPKTNDGYVEVKKIL